MVELRQRGVRGTMRQERTYCPYCGVGCGLRVTVQDGAVVQVQGDPDHPSSLGGVCAKAIFLPETLRTPDRLLFPHLRIGGHFRRVSWDAALEHIADRLQKILDGHGPAAIAFYLSGQLLTEDYYVAGKLARGFLRTPNVDANSRLCMSSAVAAYASVLGSDGPPPCYADVEVADAFLLVGTNAADCHPVLYQRIVRRKRGAPEAVKVVVVDPRRTRTAEIADLHLPIRPGSDVALLNGILHLLIREGRIDSGFIESATTGFEAVARAVAAYDPERVARLCGVPPALVIEAARIVGGARALLTLWSMGVNQSTLGVAKAQAILNLHLATGQIGRPGSGPFSLTGQPNAMGGREAGGLAHLLPGYRLVTDPEHRREVATVWGVPAEQLPSKPGLAAVELFQALRDGRVQAVWIVGTNPAASFPDHAFVQQALRRARLVVVQDAYHPTETTAFAHVLLPAAQWPEKEGVMTNSERRITYLPKLVEPPGEALPDWQIFTRFARTMGFEAHFPYESSEEVFREFAALLRGRPCDYSGVSYTRLRQEGPLQWPVPTPDHPGTERLYADARFHTPDGRARFVPVEHREPKEVPCERFPLVLLTGRVKNHWHTLTRTGKVRAFVRSQPEPLLELHPVDAGRLGIREGTYVEVRSRRGRAVVRVCVTDRVRPGTCFLPFHWGHLHGLDRSANALTSTATDPISGQPELKACAVRVRPVPARPEPADRLTRREVLRAGLGAALGLALGPVLRAWAAPATVRVGFIPLTDCASVVMAHELGLYRKYGLEVELSKEASWANVRDKLLSGELQAAHCLAAMPFSVYAGIGGTAGARLALGMILNANGQAVTLSAKTFGGRVGFGEPQKVKAAIDALQKAGKTPTFAMTFPGGTHDLWLRYWLGACGVFPKDVKIITIPPPQMVANMRVGNMDGYCVGEPWNGVAVAEGIGFTHLASQDIWKHHPEKALVFHWTFAREHREEAKSLMKAILEASRWLDHLDNRRKAAPVLARRAYVNAPAEVILERLLGIYDLGAGLGRRVYKDDPMLFHRAGWVNFPRYAYGVWFLAQYRRWGWLREVPDYLEVARTLILQDLYRAAAREVGFPVPSEDLVPLLGFIDGVPFDPRQPEASIRKYRIREV
jgi:ferredoxin-nitrate reductase